MPHCELKWEMSVRTVGAKNNSPNYLLLDLAVIGSYNVCRKEASGLRLLSSLLYT